MGIYVVDSNFFIQAHRVSYPLDVAFSFWNKVKQLAEEGKIITFIVAYALADINNRIVVTQEISEPNRKNKIKIPEACNALNIHFVNTIDMFRQMRVTF
jgi:hypothetical protein